MLRKTLSAAITACLIVSCATSPLGRKQLAFMPAAEMDSMGIQAFDNLKKETPIEKDGNINRYVSCVANILLKEMNQLDSQQWEVRVFKDDSANAFALPGGKIGVHTGLLKIAKNQGQLATVIGHEVGHVLAQHSNERMSQQFVMQTGMGLVQALANVESAKGQLVMAALGVGAQVGVLLPYSRLQESEADELGIQYMSSAGFDPQESVKLWKNMEAASEGQSPEFLSTHPSHGTRIEKLNNAMGNAMMRYQDAKAVGKKPNCR
jgi:predicted Zn-dependent protease